jgi:hypothetical protein
MIQKIYLILVCVALTFQACEKIEYVKADPQLGFTVVRDNMVFVEGATVSLFSNQQDWELKSNVVQTLQTDSKGQAIFENLGEQKYYFLVEKDELNNLADIAATHEPLKTGKRAEVLVKIMKNNF